ncbi:PREDICTED: kinesin-related protein 4 [Cyphomyrmex costatus]|uniref:Centromere protein J n=1 Tax=Cyphomyrmex costatus TaxID=456900 RepID=A0A151IHN2_9HYME|nr:PREDICTED: kinesin-related protein 4 [Cyphomyrmex costatus]XP_018396675.1 PREDICTED: kinesin-related protein 4 [Cyphomyrmex costatus]XP_018396676.1 PREDICTED: kinesin-related protein 4 [Cyphomyrmex costatus]KYN01661.1 Centromere protein J [Cyphomyrmex costatus]
MDVEVSIAERLQKLKQWQIEQQDKLLKQQQVQREILSNEQDRIYKVLGLPTHFDIIENTEDMCVTQENEMNVKETMSDKASMLQYSAKNLNGILKTIDKRISTNVPTYKNCNQEQTNDSDCISTIVDKSKNFVRDYDSELSDSFFLIEGIKPLSLNDGSNCVSVFDDVPLPSPKRDFQTILEEKLQKESEIMSNAHMDTKIKSKKPFLKKGQGLSRFKMSANLHSPLAVTKKYNKPLSPNIQHTDRSDKCKSSVARRHVSPKILDNVPVVNRKQQLSLKTVPLPKKKIFNKSITSANQVAHNITPNVSKHISEMNISDCDSKAEKELEEVRIFELLEEKAENSSFCSTSSTVLAFLQQSTPFKVKNKLSQTSGNSVASKKQQSKQISDMVEPGNEQVAHAGNLKSNVQCQVEQFEFHKHAHTNAATTNSYEDITTIDNMSERTHNCFMLTNQILQSNEAYTNCLENHDTPTTTVLSNSEEEKDISTRNECKLMYESEADVSHHVRFSEYNEYKTIDSTDASDTASDSPLNIYLKQQDWNDHSTDTLEESFDATKNLPFNYKEQIHNSSSNIISNKKTVDTPRQLFLQQDVTGHNKKDSYNHLIKTIHVLEEENASNHNDELSNEDTCYNNECTPIEVEISDEERSVLSSLLSSSSSSLLSDTQELHAYKRKEYMLKNKPEKITEKIAKICSNVNEVDCYSSEERINQMNTFETELLKNRLLELEKEINIFRKESSALLFQRRKLQEDEIILCKQYAEKEKNLEENRRRVENQLQEEKKRIMREKIAMENRIRDAQEKAKQNKMERQKAQNLQEQVEQLKDELNVKESRWNAAESRYKSELRVLRVEISKLKQEIANLQNIKRTNVRNHRKNTGQVINKAINQINKRVTIPSNEISMKTCHDLSNISSDTSDNDDEDENKTKINGFGQIESDALTNKEKYKQIKIKSQLKCNQKFMEENIAEKKRYLYENLLKDATSDLIEQNQFHTNQNVLSDSQLIVTQIQNLSTKNNDKSCSSSTNKDLGHTTADVANDTEYCINKSRELNQNSDENDVRIEKEKRKDRTLSLEKSLSSTLHPSVSENQISKTSMDAVKQIQFADGRIEYWYPNGNVKKIFPDQEVTKMIYYNGDVRETDKTKGVKYFYATTRTWHTTTSDGLEILEFPDGQVEKRMTDGTVEVLFPDGTVVQTFINGDKILILPNGQKEIHTKEHKRREYPDGTIKLVYADGTQETHYSSGRKRLKDKDGNLLMDSYDV